MAESRNLIHGPITVGNWMSDDDDGTYEVTFRVALSGRAASLFHDVASDLIGELIPVGDPGTESSISDDEPPTEISFRAPASFFKETDPGRLRMALENAANHARIAADDEAHAAHEAIDRWLAGFKREGDDAS